MSIEKKEGLSQELFERLLQRERLARKAAEQLLDQKSIELYNTNQELLALTTDLEQRVEQRTAELEAERNRAVSAAAALKESQQRFLDVANVVGEYVWELDTKFCFTFISSQVEAVMGYKVVELLGCRIFDYMSAENAADMKRSIEDAGVHRKAFTNLTHQAISKAGVEIWLRSSGTPNYNSSGDLIGYIGASLDISELKQQERELGEALQQAEAGARAKSVFLANMSHEIRTPLNGICGMAHLLMNSELPEEDRECVRSIQASGDTLLRVINDILDFSKIEAGHLDIEAVDFDLAKTLDVVHSILQANAAELGLRFDFIYPDGEIPLLKGDSSRLSEVLLNLLGNALKFTREGGVCLECRVVKRESDALTFQFAVLDTGIGMSEEELQRIFQPFAQADASIARRFGGTGLGLAISRDLVRLMGGTLSVDSTVDVGSEFVVEIPFKRSENFSAPLPQYQPAKVFVLTESDVFYRSIKSMLALLRFDVCRVESIDSAGDQYVDYEGFQSALLLVDCIIDGRQAVLSDSSPPDGLKILQVRRSRAENSDQWSGDILAYPLSRYRIMIRAYELLGFEIPDDLHSQCDITSEKSALDLSGVRVLLAEDNHINQQVARLTMEQFNASVDVAANGLEALEMAQCFQYDLILMDVRMPEMDGLEACQRIRSSGSQVPIVALTADAMKGDRERFLECGMDAYLSKPLVEADLLELLVRIRAGRSIVAETVRQAEGSLTSELPDAVSEVSQLMSKEKDLDLDALYRLLGGDRAFSRSILVEFQQTAEQSCKEAIRLLDEGESNQAKAHCHKIAGSAATVFANRVRVCFVYCERLLREGSPDIEASRSLLKSGSEALAVTKKIIEGMEKS